MLKERMIVPWPARSVGIAWVLKIALLGWLPVCLNAAEIDPTVDGSHREFLSVFSNRTEQAYQEIVAVFDRAIDSNPTNVRPLIEKCQFIAEAFPELEDDAPHKQDDLESAQAQLETRFPLDPEATLYRADQLYGPARIKFLASFGNLALATWSDAHRARRLDLLAWARYQAKDLAGAKSEAEAAMRVNPALDLSLIVASYYDSIDRSELAGRVLLLSWDSAVEPWQKARKAQLLAKSGHAREAAKLYQQLNAVPNFYVNPIDYAEALEKNDQVREAREQLVKAASRQWNPAPVRRRLFDFDLEHGDEPAAFKSYRSLCADGIGSDSFLRRRLALAGQYPVASWTGADLARLGILLAVIAGLAILPLVWVLPTHYLGLLRRAAGKAPPPEGLVWNLKDFWWVSAVWLWATFGVWYWFHYDEFAACFLQDDMVELVLNQTRLGPTALAWMVLFCAGVALGLRGRHWKLALQNEWSLGRTLLIIVVLSLFTRLVAKISGQVAASLDEGELPDASAISLRVEMILALGKTYGLGVLFLFTVLLAPWVEEFVYRGVMLESLQRHLPFHAANLLQATAFGLAHQDGVLFVDFVLFGWLAGLMRRESKGLAVPLLFHAANNLLAYLGMVRHLG